MKIDRIDLYHVAMPLIYPWRTAYGEDAEIHSVLCRMQSGSLWGWGESSPLAAPCYSPEWGGGVFAVAEKWLAPAIVGKDIASGDDIQANLGLFKGNSFAKAAIDTAWWALHSRHAGKPLHHLLGASRERVAVGADFGVMDSVDDLLGAVGEAVDDGFARVKLKFRPGWDVPIVEAVRKQHPDHPIHIDCNSGYSLDDADLFRRLDEFQLAMFEQPLAHDDLLDHAKLQSQVSTAVCLDESVKSVRHARQAAELKNCRYINIKPGRVGGLTNAVKIHDLCQRAGIECWIGGMLESAAGSSLCCALAMLDNFTYPADIFPTSRFYREDLCDPPLELERLESGAPCVSAPQSLPEPNPARLRQMTVQHAVIGVN